LPASRQSTSTAGRELERLSRGLLDLESRLGAASDAGWPRVELLELPGRLRLVADLPGVAARALRVELRGRELRLRGTLREPRRAGAALVRERPQGRFARAVALPRDVDPHRVRARLEAGRLTIELPEPRPRAVRVRIREGGAR
jgi:HSP20 family molecular chaperone IbpA